MLKPDGVANWGLWEPMEGASEPSRSYKTNDLVEASRKDAPQRVTAPYAKDIGLRSDFPSSAGSGKAGVNLRGPPRKAKYSQATDSELVP